MQAEIFALISTTHVPIQMRFAASLSGVGLFETPPTPIPKIKKKRIRKAIVATPDVAGVTALMLPGPEIENVLRPTARADEISIREEMPRQPTEVIEDDFSLGVRSRKEVEEEMRFLFAKPQDIPKDHSKYTSSEPLPSQSLIEVVAQVHAPKDRYLDENLQIVESIPVPVREMETVPGQETVPAIQLATVEEQESRLMPEPPATTSAAPAFIEQIQVRSPPEETHLEEMDRMRNKLLFRPTIKKFVQINRCNESQGWFVYDFCPLTGPYQNTRVEFLYDLFWTEEDMENIQIRGLGTSNSSSLTGLMEEVRRSRTVSTRPSALESVSEGGIGQTVQTLEIPEQERTLTGSRGATEDAIKQMPIGEPVVPSSTPRKRKLIELAEGDDKLPKERRDVKQPRAIPIPTTEIPISRGQTAEPTHDVEIEVQGQLPLGAVIPPVETEISASDYKLRQQRIIDRVISWTGRRGILTIEDVCEKPINKLNIARAFLDLLTLARNGFLVLKSKEDAIELRSIERGPKLMGQ